MALAVEDPNPLSPLLEVVDPNVAAGVLVWIIVLLVASTAAMVLFGWLLFRAGQLHHPGPIVVSLSMLTSIALVGGLLTDSVEALTLAATGLGALAGSLSAIYRARPEEPATPENEEGEGEG